MRHHIILVLIGFYSLIAIPAIGAELTLKKEEPNRQYEVRTGVLLHDVNGLWSRSRKEGGIDFNAEIVFVKPSLDFSSGTIHPNFGLSINNQGDTSNLYLGFFWERKTTSGIFLDLGVGAAVHNGELEATNPDKKGLGSRVLFRIPIEIGYLFDKHHRFSLIFVHLSNAYLAYPNEGLDVLGLRYGYSF